MVDIGVVIVGGMVVVVWCVVCCWIEIWYKICVICRSFFIIIRNVLCSLFLGLHIEVEISIFGCMLVLISVRSMDEIVVGVWV